MLCNAVVQSKLWFSWEMWGTPRVAAIYFLGDID